MPNLAVTFRQEITRLARRANPESDAGTLEVAPGIKYMESAEFPKEWMMGAISTAGVTNTLRQHPELDWTALSPPHLIRPGIRTGVFRLGGDQGES